MTPATAPQKEAAGIAVKSLADMRAIESAFVSELLRRCKANFLLPCAGESDEYSFDVPEGVTTLRIVRWFCTADIELHGFKFWLEITEFSGGKLWLKWECVKGLENVRSEVRRG